MTPERLAKIREFAANRWLHGFDPQTVRDLLDHIAAQDQRIAELEAGQGSAGAELADLIRKRYPRLLERGNPLYDGTLDDAIGRIKEGGPIEAGRVVVAELTNDDELEAFNGHRDPTEDEIHALRIGYALAISRIRAIPSGRVPGEGQVAIRWIPVSESLPDDGESVGFIIDSPRDEWNHGRAVGGRFNRKHFDKGFGGFSFPGIEWLASHWCRFPPAPDALRSGEKKGGEG